MKKTLLLLSIVMIAFVGCKDDDNGLLDPTAMISIWGQENTRTTTNPEHLSPLEIVKQATEMASSFGARGFDPAQRDLENIRFLMFGTDVISTEGELVLEFIEDTDYVLRRFHVDESFELIKVDTIGYMKNSIVRSAEVLIKDAFAKGDYETCYNVFDNAFSYLPITGAEYRELEANGEN